MPRTELLYLSEMDDTTMLSKEHRQSDDVGMLPLPPIADLNVISRPERAFVELYQQYGPIFRLVQSNDLPYGSIVHPPSSDVRLMTVLAGPEANVFLTRDGDKYIATQLFWEAFDRALGYEKRRHDGEAHRQYRRIISRGYSRPMVTDRLPEMIEITREVSASWRSGQRIAVVPWMRRLIAEQLGGLLLQHRPGERLTAILRYFQTAITSALLGLSPQSDLEQPAFIQARAEVLAMAQEILDQHRQHPPLDRKKDVVDDVLAAAPQFAEIFSERDLLVSAIIPYIAGLGTIVHTAAFLFYTLPAHPAVFQRVIEEVDQIWAKGQLEKDQLKEMPALHGAAMETLRLYQTTSAWDGVARKPFAFEGYRVDAGDQVFCATTVSQFLSRLFPNPESFDVDRYRDPRNEHRQPGAFAPFGIGDHSCLGASIAEIQLIVIFATLLRNYRWEIDPDRSNFSIVPALTPAPGDDFTVTIVER
jgi:cytochrome P450